MKFTLLFIFVCLSVITFAKEPDPEKVLEEGKQLYRLEKASWYATDDFFTRFAHKTSSAGIYISYISAEGNVNTVFFDKNNPDQLLVRYTFDFIPKTMPLIVDTVNLEATILEKDLKAIKTETGKLAPLICISYENTGFNFIPIITPEEKKVYILTAPKEPGAVLIGNDYCFTFDSKNKYKDMKRLHRSLISLPYKSNEANNPLESSFHSHVVSDIIDPTDICTLLLYKDFTEWKKHIVLGKKYVSIFDMENESLNIITRKEWDKLEKNKKNSD
ncbi:hypothetical protein [Prevotella sp. 10(H)]|uniref:hypothetical protein n=1 Tax=Prevotella sp. 10(H) TaxID=1158294 RepID=UPI0004A6C711|nr:hypothetical protein [Prevotella sp. 10(H)]